LGGGGAVAVKLQLLADLGARRRHGKRLDALERLVDKSMVRLDDAGRDTRFGMLETIRDYAREKLRASGREAEVLRRHASWCVEAAGEPYELVERERENLRAALHWAIDEGHDVELGASICLAAHKFWLELGYLTEGRRWTAAAIAKGEDLPRSERSKAERYLCSFLVSQGDYQEARTILDRLTEEGADNDRETTLALQLRAHVEERMGDYERATQIRERSLALARTIGEPHAIGVVLNSLGLAALDRGEYERAAEIFEEALSLFRAAGEMANTAVTLHNLGEIAFRLGDNARAVTLLEESLVIGREQNLQRVLAYSSQLLGTVAVAMRDLERARALFRDAMTLDEAAGDRDGIAYVLEGFASLAAVEGNGERALRLAAAASTVRASIGSTLPPPERAAFDARMGEARAALDPDVADRAIASGAALSQRDAIRLALE